MKNKFKIECLVDDTNSIISKLGADIIDSEQHSGSTFMKISTEKTENQILEELLDFVVELDAIPNNYAPNLFSIKFNKVFRRKVQDYLKMLGVDYFWDQDNEFQGSEIILYCLSEISPDKVIELLKQDINNDIDLYDSVDDADFTPDDEVNIITLRSNSTEELKEIVKKLVESDKLKVDDKVDVNIYDEGINIRSTLYFKSINVNNNIIFGDDSGSNYKKIESFGHILNFKTEKYNIMTNPLIRKKNQ